MIARIDYFNVAPEAIKAMFGVEKYVNASGLEKSLLNLVKIRASQINGCAYCLDMHCDEARKAGEDERRLSTIAAWRDTSFFTERERSALAWAEAVTLISQSHAPDDVYQKLTQYFSETEIVNLTMAIVAINSWNRLSISFARSPQ